MSAEEVKIEGFEPNLENMEKMLTPDIDYMAKEFKWGKSYEINGWLLENVENYGGEGQGDDYWVVVKASKDDQVSYWKFYGWYASHQGGELESVVEVKPVEKLVTVWK